MLRRPALGQIAPGTARADEAIAGLADALRRAHPRRRAPLVDALSQFKQVATAATPALVEVLMRTLPSEPNAQDGGVETATALGRIAPGTNRADEAVEALNAALEARSDDTRFAAIRSLGRFGADAIPALPRLRKLENDPHREVKAAAAALVAKLTRAP